MLAVLLLVLWPAAEVYVLINVAEAIGVPLTVLLLIAGWPVGTWALRSQGRAAWTKLRLEVSSRRAPGRAVLDGALVLIGGVLLIVPGFIGDVVGIALLFGPTRRLAGRIAARRLTSRVMGRAWRYRRPARGYDVDSTASDIDQTALHR